MPRCIIPQASSAHRAACKEFQLPNSHARSQTNSPGLALYRALLKQSSTVGVGHNDDGPRSKGSEVLSNLVQFRFRQDRKLLSPTQIINGLKAGYAALDLVHACNNKSPTATAQLKSLLGSTASRAEYIPTYRAALAAARSPTSPDKLRKIAHLKAIATKANSTRHPGSKPVIERPLPLSEIKGGKRRVPNLVSAQGVPFLRYRKPQPISLSRVIKQKQGLDQKRLTQQEGLRADTIIAQWEDEWDEVTEAHKGEERGQNQDRLVASQASTDFTADEVREESWRHEPTIAEVELYQQMKETDRKNAELGRQMWGVLAKERELAEQEKREAKIQRRLKRKAATAAGAREDATAT